VLVVFWFTGIESSFSDCPDHAIRVQQIFLAETHTWLPVEERVQSDHASQAGQVDVITPSSFIPMRKKGIKKGDKSNKIATIP
jgi:hypothetical protein